MSEEEAEGRGMRDTTVGSQRESDRLLNTHSHIIYIYMYICILDTTNMVKTRSYLYLNNEIYFTSPCKCWCQGPDESTGQINCAE